MSKLYKVVVTGTFNAGKTRQKLHLPAWQLIVPCVATNKDSAFATLKQLITLIETPAPTV